MSVSGSEKYHFVRGEERRVQSLGMFNIDVRANEVIVERISDTCADAALHFKRFGIRDLLGKSSTCEGMDKRSTVVVIGSGWSAHAMLQTIATDLYRVIVERYPLRSFSSTLSTRRALKEHWADTCRTRSTSCSSGKMRSYYHFRSMG